GRSAIAGPISVNKVCSTSLSRIALTTWRRLAIVSVFALVIRCSAYGRRRRALAWVVVISPYSNRLRAKLASINFWCAGPPPKRVPFVGVGMDYLQSLVVSGLLVLLVFSEARIFVVGERIGVETSRTVLEAEPHLI